jgi:putative nucleotidyltransferase with HDIG domain
LGVSANEPAPPARADKRRLAAGIVRDLRAAGHEAYFVGGCVRDLVLKRKPYDFDIATSATPDQVEKIFPRTIAVGKAFGVIVVREGNESFEVATFREDLEYKDGRRPEGVKFSTAKTDALRRDFTVNGLFYDPVSKKVLDWVGGRADARKKVIRTIGRPLDRFKEDKLRMLRAVRFAANLGFKIDPAALKAIQKMRKEIKAVSAERVRDELVKLFTGPHPAQGLDWLDKSGLLPVVLPEIEALKGCEQPKQYHPEGDVYKHTRLLLAHLKKPSLTLAFGALLHDIGKPRTSRTDKTGRIRFNGHDLVGARMAEEVLTRLKFSNDAKEDIKACVEWHMQFKDAPQMKPATLKRMMQRRTFETELEQHRVDCLASHGNLKIWRFLRKKLRTLSQEEIRPEPFLRGRDLIDLGIPPGPQMGALLKAAEEKQLNGDWKTREDALAWVQTAWAQRKDPA